MAKVDHNLLLGDYTRGTAQTLVHGGFPEAYKHVPFIKKKEKMMATHFENMTCQNIPEQNSKLKEANCRASEFFKDEFYQLW